MLRFEMLRLRRAPIVFLFLCSLGSPQAAMAQARRTLVVVTDHSDAEYVRRIGDKLVEVEVLLLKGAPDRSGYTKCNDRVKQFREFQYLFYREANEGLTERFWRQRLIAANPKGAAHRLPSTRRTAVIEFKAERARVIHGIFSEAFPDHRQQLDANLTAELLRLYSVSTPPLQFASLHE